MISISPPTAAQIIIDEFGLATKSVREKDLSPQKPGEIHACLVYLTLPKNSAG
jgi:hypothetical protein